jgi:hypothetical protein
MHDMQLSGPSPQDKLVEASSSALAKVLENTLLGAPGSKSESARVEFFASVLSRTGEKFVESPTGKETVNKALFVAAVPAFLLGLFAGYLLYNRRKS